MFWKQNLAVKNIKMLLAHRVPRIYSIAKWVYLHLQSFVTNSSPQEIVFTRIYRNGGWGTEESFSGSGSTLRNTQNIRSQLPTILREYSIVVLLDIPCGDFHWMREVDLATTQYVGADIEKELVKENIRLHSSASKAFLHLDLLSDALPASDAILCRDCLPHLPLKEIVRALRNVKRSSAKYFITSDYPSCTINEDIAMGKFRRISFQHRPFLFPPPLVRIEDSDGVYIDKSLAVRQTSDIPGYS